jgi:type II restriction/modification system DNA methylase subunit YeeA
MDTKPLERFATQARRELIAAVDAQATAVLATGSVARSERAEVVKKLEAEITAHGRTHVIDKVAYTWFNRIIALRFMDARSYTDAGIVSPAQGQAHGQPEILADAKRGNLNTDVVINKNTADAIIGLLDGTRRSTDAEGEAYALLLTDYCRYWHKSMSFMFEREGDYTELLVPTGLLADGAILSRAREVLTEEVCDDVEVIGWLYQFYISERKDEVFAGFKKNKKAGPDEIPAATQLFTPHWIVRYLVENSLGRLWLLNRPSSRLADQMEYYIAPVDEETDYLKIAGPEEIKVIDPACGSGHMLTYAFDLLYAIYEEEGYAPSDIPGLILTHNLYGTEIDPRAGALAAFALTMKARGRQRTFFNKQVQPNICVLEPISFAPSELNALISLGGDRHNEEAFWRQFEHADTFGSLIRPREELIDSLSRHLKASVPEDGDLFASDLVDRAWRVTKQAEYLTGRYTIAIANPPYMGGGNMEARLAEFAQTDYLNSKSDLFAMFIERCLELVIRGGATAMITMQSWMFLASFEQLRVALVASTRVVSAAHLGTSAFDTISGAVVSTVAFVLENRPPRSKAGVYIRLTEGRSERAKVGALLRSIATNAEKYVVPQDAFTVIPGSPIAYWLSKAERDAFRTGVPLGGVVALREGINTGNNERFLRRWWEVDIDSVAFDTQSGSTAGRKWVPMKKGGTYRKWAGNQEYVVNWSDDGVEIRNFRDSQGRLRSRPQNTQFFFRESGSWGRISTDDFSMRHYGEGFAFDSTGPSAFGDETSLVFALALLNSSVARRFLGALSPTLDFRLTSLGRIPVPPAFRSFEASHVKELIMLAQDDWDRQEIAWRFKTTPFVEDGSGRLLDGWAALTRQWSTEVERVRSIEQSNNEAVAALYALEEIDGAVPTSRVTLSVNPDYRFSTTEATSQRLDRLREATISDLVSYAVGCMFGRYSLDEPGLIIANQGETLRDYLAKVPNSTFTPDKDNVVPFVDDGWFEDDIVARFRQFLRVAFGEAHFEENLRFVEESLGVKSLRDYFITRTGKSKFYDDHVQRYKKRPIYWMFSSPKGSFNALVYMHRYNPSTVPTVLNEYLREYRAKLEVALTNAEQAAAAGSTKDQKEADRLRKVLSELRDYEHDVLYPLATQQLTIDLNDGVKENYPKFYPALKRIAGLEAAE